MTNEFDNVLYTGVTSNLPSRIWPHKESTTEGFTKKYNLNKLVYYEVCPDMYSAITREKQIKAGTRKKKLELIKTKNPFFKDLSSGL